MRAAWVAAAVSCLVMGCEMDSASPRGGEQRPADAGLPKGEAGSAAGGRADRLGRVGAEPAPARPEELPPSRSGQRFGAAADPATSMIIRTGHATIEVDSLEPAVAALRIAASQLDGHVANATISRGREQHRTAVLEIKVPAARFDELVDLLPPIGHVGSVDITAQDVGEEYVDVTARMANSRRLEERLIGLLATRTGKLQDVLDVERELARVREEIERYDGRLRFLRARTAFSTLSVSIHEPLPITGNPSAGDVLAEAFRRAWRNLLGVVAGAIASLGVLVPLVLVGGTIVVAVRRWRRPAAAQ